MSEIFIGTILLDQMVILLEIYRLSGFTLLRKRYFFKKSIIDGKNSSIKSGKWMKEKNI